MHVKRPDCAAVVGKTTSSAHSEAALRYGEPYNDEGRESKTMYRARYTVGTSGWYYVPEQDLCTSCTSEKSDSIPDRIVHLPKNMYACPYPGCTQIYKTPSGIRKHWTSSNGHPGEVPKLYAAEIAISGQQCLKAQDGDGHFSDHELIQMMGLCDGQVDTRSSGRFSRSSRLSNQQSGKSGMFILTLCTR